MQDGRKNVSRPMSLRSPQRISITCEAGTDGSGRRELPFVIGVLADLTGRPGEPLPRLAAREFVYLNGNNFDHVLAAAAPHLSFNVSNRLTDDDTRLRIELKFRQIDDFSPAN